MEPYHSALGLISGPEYRRRRAKTNGRASARCHYHWERCRAANCGLPTASCRLSTNPRSRTRRRLLVGSPRRSFFAQIADSARLLGSLLLIFEKIHFPAALRSLSRLVARAQCGSLSVSSFDLGPSGRDSPGNVGVRTTDPRTRCGLDCPGFRPLGDFQIADVGLHRARPRDCALDRRHHRRHGNCLRNRIASPIRWPIASRPTALSRDPEPHRPSHRDGNRRSNPCSDRNAAKATSQHHSDRRSWRS